MPFRFSHVCQLLNDLENIRCKDPPPLTKDRDVEEKRKIDYWFRVHRKDIDSPNTDLAALLSTLFPERRTDRVYAIQETRLLNILARCLHLNHTKVQELHSCKQPGRGDLAACLERLLKVHDVEPKPSNYVTVEQIDHALNLLAARSRYSSAQVRSSAEEYSEPHEILKSILLRLNSIEAKWFTRLILKDFAPVHLPQYPVLKHLHFLLPGLLLFQDSFTYAAALLRGPLNKYHSDPDTRSQALFRREAAKELSPQFGVKVGRPPYHKAWSIDNCLKMTRRKRWAIERKYDGEYCEVHVDLHSQSSILRIFSKSGKDSTWDRKSIHNTIKQCLRVGREDCAFKSRCIVIGELVVFSEKEQRIQEFYRLRRHVTRSGRFLGTDNNSPLSKDEHLMVIFHDVLLVDSDITMTMPYEKRRQRLKTLITKIPGHAATSEWKIHDFAMSGSDEVLMYQLTDTIAKRLEGLVLKPAGSPYFSFGAEPDDDHVGYFIKVKKDYLLECGGEKDVADLSVIGASYNSKLALKAGIKSLKYTTYFLGCLVNDAVRFEQVPRFEIIGSIQAGPAIPKSELLALNQYAQFHDCNQICDGKATPSFSIANPDKHKVESLFIDPCVVEVLGSGYDKPSDERYFALRHPRVLKIHSDRSWKDATTFDELQELADKSRKEPSQGVSQERSTQLSRIQQRYNAKRARDVAKSFPSPVRRSPLTELDHISPQRSLPSSFTGVENLINAKRRRDEDMNADQLDDKRRRISVGAVV